MSTTALRRYFRGATLVAMQDVAANTRKTYHYDHLGTVQCLTDSTGAVTDRFAADAWGAQVKRTGSSINRQWFVGNLGYARQVDQAIDYVRARYLLGRQARWCTLDPASEPTQRANRYHYADNQTARMVDPSGLRTCWLVFTMSQRGNNQGELKLVSRESYPGEQPEINVDAVLTAWSGAQGCGPESQCVQCRGPIPNGCYQTAAAWEEECRSKSIDGPCLWLTPPKGGLCANRSGLLIHTNQADLDSRGGSRKSQGCIVLTPNGLAALRAILTFYKCPLPLQLIVAHSGASEGECTHQQVGLNVNCQRVPQPPNVTPCNVGCGAGR